MDKFGPELLSRLLDEHGARLVLLAQQWCDTPEDAVQEAFIRLMTVKPKPEKPAAWLYRVVRNAAISAARGSYRRTRHEAAAASDGVAWFAVTSEDRIDASAAVDALKTLPVQQREAVVLRLWSDMTFAEISEITDASPSTAHRRYVEGLAALRVQLGVPAGKPGRVRP